MIAAWRRPEFLLVSLCHIWAATYADDHEFIFIFDHDVDPLVRAVATAFPATHKRMHYTPAHEFISGNRFVFSTAPEPVTLSLSPLLG